MFQDVASQVSSRTWWLLALRGVLSIILGLVALLAPGIALLAFITVFAVYAILDGVTAVIVALRERGVLRRWGLVLAEGILSILAGVFAFAYPGETAIILLYIVAAWAIITGIMEIAAVFVIRGSMAQEWSLAIAGILSVLFGIVLFIRPGLGLLSILWLVGIYAIIFGVLFIVRAFQFRSRSSSPTLAA